MQDKGAEHHRVLRLDKPRPGAGAGGQLRRIMKGVMEQLVQKQRTGRELLLIDTLDLGGKRRLFLVRCGNQNFLIGAGGEAIHTIAALADTGNASCESGCKQAHGLR